MQNCWPAKIRCHFVYKHAPCKLATILLLKYTVSKLVSAKFLQSLNSLPWELSREPNLYLLSHVLPRRRFWVYEVLLQTKGLGPGQCAHFRFCFLLPWMGITTELHPSRERVCRQMKWHIQTLLYVPRRKEPSASFFDPVNNFWPALCCCEICHAVVSLLSCSVEYHQFHATLLGTSDWSTEGGVFILCYQTPNVFQKLWPEDWVQVWV